MSWQAYVDTNLVGSGKVTKAAILGQQGGVWATSAGFQLSTDEQKAVVNAYKNKEHTQSSGLRLDGQKYFTLSVDDRTIQLKKMADGAVIVKTKQAILVAVYIAPTQSPETSSVVENLADYLIRAGY